MTPSLHIGSVVLPLGRPKQNSAAERKGVANQGIGMRDVNVPTQASQQSKPSNQVPGEPPAQNVQVTTPAVQPQPPSTLTPPKQIPVAAPHVGVIGKDGPLKFINDMT